MSPAPATALLAAVRSPAFLIDRVWALAAMTLVLLVICLRAPVQRRWLYISGVLLSALGVIVISPLTWSSGGGTLLWEGPTLPVIGPLDLSTDEIRIAVVNGLRLAVVGLAFSAYTLLVDHDRLVSAAGFARRSALAVALATRLVPSLERDAAGLAESVRGRGVELHGARGYAMLLSPLVAGSLERATGLAEAMEARGFGRSGATRAPRPAWTWVDHVALVGAVRTRRGGGTVAVATVDAACRSRIPAALRRCGTSRSSSRPVRSSRCSARPGAASRRCCARSPGSCRISTVDGSRVGSRSAGSTRGRTAPPSSRARVASVFQDPEDQVVMTRVENEVAFGLENLGVAPELIWPRVAAGARRRRGVAPRGSDARSSSREASCSASASPRRSRSSPRLLLLDEPTSQLDAGGAEAFLAAVDEARCAVVLSEQRVDRALAIADRVIMMEEGRIVLDAPVAEARAWLAAHRPRYAGGLEPARSGAGPSARASSGQPRNGPLRLREGPGRPRRAVLVVHRGEIVALEGNERMWQDDACEDRRRPRRTDAAGRSPGADERPISPRIPAGTSSAKPRSRRLRSASGVTR